MIMRKALSHNGKGKERKIIKSKEAQLLFIINTAYKFL